MKIGIVTLVSDNYGNKYQNYAVEQLLSEYGEVVTYAVEPKAPDPGEELPLVKKLRPRYIDQVLRSRMMYLYDVTNDQRSTLGNLWYVTSHKKQILKARKQRSLNFNAFQKQHLHISDRVITHENCRDAQWNGSHDYFVCGSDQIWNPAYGTTSDLAFASFARGKSIALAPSFGVSAIPAARQADYRDWLNGIDVLSVREDAGKQIIRDLTGRDAEVLLDPTMAIPPEHWEELTREPTAKLPEKYILTYFLGRVTKAYKKRIRQISGQTGLPVIDLFQIEDPERYVFGPGEVLWAIRNASMVLTDSFHGSVFSILFQRDFVVFPRDEEGGSMHSRLATLLGKFGLEGRLDDGVSSPVSIDSSVWERIERLLTQERQRTKDYLAKAINTR